MLKVSVIVPIYGVEAYIERCARSIFEQSYANIEFIFVDDCSIDRSIQILKNVIAEYPQRGNNITILSLPHNCGLAGARNSGIHKATGDFIIHIDADDYVDRDLVKKAVESQMSCDSDIVIWDYYIDYGTYKRLISQKEISNVHKRVLSLLKKDDMPCVWCNMIRRSLYNNYSIRNEEGVDYSEDYQIMPQLTYYAQRLSYIKEPLYYYNCSNSSSYTNNLNPHKMEQLFKTIDILSVFFNEKGTSFIDALRYSEVFSLSQYMNVVISQNNHNYDFKMLHDRWESMDSRYKSLLPIWRRLLFMIPDNFILMVYVVTGMKIQRFFRSLFHK